MEYTKAGMLIHIKEHVLSVNILPALVVSSQFFFENVSDSVEQILEFSQGKPVIVRSSSALEDTGKYSNAGKFESVLNVPPQYNDIKKAIEVVYASYETNGNEEILIQPMLKNIKRSGVVFTKDMITFADYYIVNYHDGEDSAAVTGGSTNAIKTFVKYKFSNFKILDPNMERLLEDCKKIEDFLKNDALDIEFALTEDGNIYILQVRPIAAGNKENYAKTDLTPALKRTYKKVKKLSMRHPFLLGDTTCFGVMPDWNPAEILGVRPKKLAISLYKELVTDNVWAHQRYNYGYRDLTMHPLMISFCGVPYIDTRITFNSFIPQNLNSKIAEKLVNYYLDKLARYPMYHDKIEFEIVYSCYYLGIHDDLKELLNYGFNENEITRIEFSLLELTNHIIRPDCGLYKNDINKIVILEKNYNKIVNSDISLVDKIYWLLEECKEYGTLPFAGVARAGFIAVQFLKSFVSRGIINVEEYENYMKSLDTINRRMNCDLKKYYKGEMTKDNFIELYGHIRPGTYDILSKRYDEAFDDYFGNSSFSDKEDKGDVFSFSEERLKQIQIELEQNGLMITAEALLTFIKESIEGREQLKFVFSKSVSKILQLIEDLGIRVDIPKEDMAHLDILLVKQLYMDLYNGDIRTIFEENIKNNKIQYKSAVQMKLPSIIVKPEDIYSFYMLSEEPNYITQKAVTADVVLLEEKKYNLEGNIVLIRSADPGYDYIFSKGIGGLITQFGGANSHMAIRCAEFGIPAIIGAGEKNYSIWSKYERMKIDCLNKQVIKIK